MTDVKEDTTMDQLRENITCFDSLISITDRVIRNPKEKKESLFSLIKSERGLRKKQRESVIALHSLGNKIIDKGRGSISSYSIAQKNINQYAK